MSASGYRTPVGALRLTWWNEQSRYLLVSCWSLVGNDLEQATHIYVQKGHTVYPLIPTIASRWSVQVSSVCRQPSWAQKRNVLDLREEDGEQGGISKRVFWLSPVALHARLTWVLCKASCVY